MPDYLQSISRVSNVHNKEVKILDSILNYYYWLNKLNDNVNSQMKMKSSFKPLTLAGKFKISYDKNNIVFNRIIFTSPEFNIIIKGSFMKIDDSIVYYKHREISFETYDMTKK
uniref:Uncharacterized protein n=1 Tax=viral metagenome TaxID=1070528 RepID=A0A6C0CFJ5_9ZZZZ